MASGLRAAAVRPLLAFPRGPDLTPTPSRRGTDGPVLSQTDLYLLGTELELNPILSNTSESFQLIFNLSTGAFHPSVRFHAQASEPPHADLAGQTGGYNHEARDRDIPFTAKEEPATMPRVEEIIIITEFSPWCTIVKNPAGVTLGDICTTLFKE